MQTKEGQDFTLPEEAESATVEVFIYPHGDPEKNPNSHLLVLHKIDVSSLCGLRIRNPSLRGVPAYFAYRPEGKEVLFYPLPGRSYHGKIMYCPTRKVI